jgi:hypothetical protein
VGDHEAALRRDKALQAGDGVLDEGAVAEDVEELLGLAPFGWRARSGCRCLRP